MGVWGGLGLEEVRVRFGDEIFGLLAESSEGVGEVFADGGDFGGGGKVGFEFDVFVWEIFDGVKVEMSIFVDGEFATLATELRLDGEAKLGDDIGAGDIIGNRGSFDDVEATILYVAVKNELILGGLVGLVDFGAEGETGEVGMIFVIPRDVNTVVLPIGGTEGEVSLS